jgi:hypothetical protein
MQVTARLPLSVVAAAVLVLNLADALFTLIYVELGLAVEGNPLMSQPLGDGPLRFMLVKLALVSLGVLLLFRLRQRRAAAIALVASAVAYSSLFVYHLSAVPALVAVAGA